MSIATYMFSSSVKFIFCLQTSAMFHVRTTATVPTCARAQLSQLSHYKHRFDVASTGHSLCICMSQADDVCPLGEVAVSFPKLLQSMPEVFGAMIDGPLFPRASLN
jgi:hypothetical protein